MSFYTLRWKRFIKQQRRFVPALYGNFGTFNGRSDVSIDAIQMMTCPHMKWGPAEIYIYPWLHWSEGSWWWDTGSSLSWFSYTFLNAGYWWMISLDNSKMQYFHLISLFNGRSKCDFAPGLPNRQKQDRGKEMMNPAIRWGFLFSESAVVTRLFQMGPLCRSRQQRRKEGRHDLHWCALRREPKVSIND